MTPPTVEQIACVLEDANRDYPNWPEIAHMVVARYAPVIEGLTRERDHFATRCLRYNEIITILYECDHGDELTCGCRDKATAMMMDLLPRADPTPKELRGDL